ncbi:unnamed protein product [Arabidopsis halleri]
MLRVLSINRVNHFLHQRSENLGFLFSVFVSGLLTYREEDDAVSELRVRVEDDVVQKLGHYIKLSEDFEVFLRKQSMKRKKILYHRLLFLLVDGIDLCGYTTRNTPVNVGILKSISKPTLNFQLEKYFA